MPDGEDDLPVSIWMILIQVHDSEVRLREVRDVREPVSAVDGDRLGPGARLDDGLEASEGTVTGRVVAHVVEL